MERRKFSREFKLEAVQVNPNLGVAELSFLAAIAPDAPDAQFFVGDLGQRIFASPSPGRGSAWMCEGVPRR